MHNHYSTLNPISHEFVTHGTAGTGLTLVAERRMAERQRNQAAALLAADHPNRSLRWRLGSWLIRTGRELAGERAPVPQTTAVGG